MEKKQMRNLRIRQLLLLLLRTVIILLLVTAFARPTLQHGAGGLLAERSPIEAVIILDNSLSLNETRLTGSLLEKLRQAFNALAPVFQASDRITVIQATHPQEVLIRQEAFQGDMWERVLQKLQPNYLKSDLDNALLSALAQLQQSIYASREIYLISDFQQSALQNREFSDMLQQPQYRDIKLFTIPVRHENLENISIDSVEVVNRLIEINQPLRIKAFLRNHHPDKYLNTLTSVLLNDQRVAQQKVSLAPGQLTETLFQLTLTENGFIRGRIETESDALQEDNRRYFNFYVPEQIKVLHIYPDETFASFIPLIIQPAREQGIFRYEGEAAANWAGRNFMDYDMVILEGLNQLPPTLVQRLGYFCEQGGGALIIPGDQIVIPQYRELFNTLRFGDLLALRGTPGSTGQFLTLQEFQWDHPIFEGLFEDQKRQLNPIEVYASYRINPAENTDLLIQFSDRSPLLSQSVIEQGTAFLMSAPLSPAWSQLPVKGFVVPLVYRMIYYAGTRKVLDRQQIPNGEVFQQQFANLEAPYQFQVVGENDVEIKLTPRFRGSNVFLEFRETKLPGNYRLMHNERTLSILSVNPWKEESELRFYDSAALDELLPGARHLDDTANISEAVQQSRFGKELWKYFLMAAFILLFVEMLLARTGARKEYQEQVLD